MKKRLKNSESRLRWSSCGKWIERAKKMALCDRCRISGCCLNCLSDACKNIRKRECPDIVFNRADYIRSMSDEQMARELIDMIADLCEDGVPCYDLALEWFRKPVEEG